MSDAKRVLVIGGTGTTGGRLVQRLRDLGHEPVVASRSGDLRFDWHDATTHRPAVAGVDAVYLIAPRGSTEPVNVMAPFVADAIATGVDRFVLLSASSIPIDGPAMGGVHRVLADTAPEWAVLRPSWFMQNFAGGRHAESIRAEGAIYSATGAGRVGFIDADDIAEVALHALVDPVPVNSDLLITGPELLSYDDVAGVISAAAGGDVRHVRMTEDALAAQLAALGLADGFARMLAGMDTAIAGGAEDRTTTTVADVTGRPPRSFGEFVRAHAAVWRR